MSTPPTGRREHRDGKDYVVFTRAFRAPVEDVWAAVTEPRRLERWIGTWSGDPASGQVAFRMTAEGEDAPEEIQTIDACDPPHRLVTRSRTPGPDGKGEVDWVLELDLSEAGGVTTLTFAQVVPDAEMASSVGPGWDYYLDRLVAAETAAEVADLSFDDYYPSQAEHYRSLFER
jgi:uncharacterized protein YndB with AHSA1/START domain